MGHRDEYPDAMVAAIELVWGEVSSCRGGAEDRKFKRAFRQGPIMGVDSMGQRNTLAFTD